MRWAAAHGCAQYDLWGVPDADLETLESQFTGRSDGLWGVYGYKRKFGGELQRTVGAGGAFTSLPCSPSTAGSRPAAGGVRVTVSLPVDFTGWNERIARLPGAHLLQTREWAAIKQAYGWQALPQVIEPPGLPSAAALVLQRTRHASQAARAVCAARTAAGLVQPGTARSSAGSPGAPGARPKSHLHQAGCGSRTGARHSRHPNRPTRPDWCRRAGRTGAARLALLHRSRSSFATPSGWTWTAAKRIGSGA